MISKDLKIKQKMNESIEIQNQTRIKIQNSQDRLNQTQDQLSHSRYTCQNLEQQIRELQTQNHKLSELVNPKISIDYYLFAAIGFIMSFLSDIKFFFMSLFKQSESDTEYHQYTGDTGSQKYSTTNSRGSRSKKNK